MRCVPAVRVREMNESPVNPGGEFVLYWMTAFRRTQTNFALQRAVEHALEFDKPLVILEALECDYPWASDRLHRFILDGMCDNEESLRESAACYYPYAEPKPGAGKGLLQSLARDACVVIADDWPAFFLPKLVRAAAEKVRVRLEAVDSNGLLPLRATPRAFTTANSFRIYLKKHLAAHLQGVPERDCLSKVALRSMGSVPGKVEKRWPRASRALLDGAPSALLKLPIDHEVLPVAHRGGSREGLERLQRFVKKKLARYGEDRSAPEEDGTSRLSPYLHFGHISTHDVLEALVRHEKKPRKELGPVKGARRSLVGLSEEAEAFLDELVTWRELGFNTISKREDATRFESLPEWAKRTLDKHRKDPRPRRATPKKLEQAGTDDRVFNAAQRQLLAEGWFHNSARMIWGKKILEYSATPEEALKTMTHLMSRYSLDGRDPNSVSGFFWVLGRYDRPWGPERPIFGTVRYMSSDTPDKLRKLRGYVEKWAPLR